MDIVNYALGNKYKQSGAYEETTTISWDGVARDESLKVYHPSGSGFFYKASNTPLTKNQLINSVATIKLANGTIAESINNKIEKDHLVITNDYIADKNDTFYISVFRNNTIVSDVTFDKGLYFLLMPISQDVNIFMSSISFKTSFPLQNKYVPLAEDGIKGGFVGTSKTESMLAPVGIDENGKLFAEQQFYDTRETKELTLTFDGNLEGKEYVEMDNGYMVKYSDFVPSYESLNNVNITITQKDKTDSVILQKDNFSYTSSSESIAYIDNRSGAMICISSGTVSFSDTIVLGVGVWCFYVVDDLITDSVTFNYNAGELKQIDEKYIPNIVYDWAKEETKPTYTADEVGALSSDSLSFNDAGELEVTLNGVTKTFVAKE